MATRRLIYAPEICAGSVLHFAYQSTDDRSFCLRLYRGSGGPEEYRQDDFAEEVTNRYLLARVQREWAAEAVPLTDHPFWHGRIAALNRQVLGHAGDPTAALLLPGRSTRDRRAGEELMAMPVSPAAAEPDYPSLDLPLLLRHPKARKPQDLHRIYTSRNSEDWVTWNVTRLWERAGTAAWWRALLGKARQGNPGLELEYDAEDLPTLTPWLAVNTPSSYEHASRLRLRSSTDPQHRERAEVSRPVEGESEIDLVLEGRRFLVFAEAKLHSDISLRTTYDPDRNQIVRNIDCLLDRVGPRVPCFWMLVRDAVEHRHFARVLREYQETPERLYGALPHRPERQLEQVRRNLVILEWRDLLDFAPVHAPGEAEQAVWKEVCYRTGCVPEVGSDRPVDER